MEINDNIQALDWLLSLKKKKEKSLIVSKGHSFHLSGQSWLRRKDSPKERNTICTMVMCSAAPDP